MLAAKHYYQQEAGKTAADISSAACDFLFALLADSHLDEGVEATVQNIAAVDRICAFDCAIHLGDFMTGNITRSYTGALLAQQMALFQGATAGGVFYPVQGNHDGFLENDGRVSPDRILDEDWHAATAFLDQCPHIHRPAGRPYYYADHPEHRLRLIFLNTQYYSYDSATKAYRHFSGIDTPQLQWLTREALALDAGWTVLLFSHDGPIEEAKRAPDSTWTNGSAVLQAVSGAAAQREIDVAGWFVGHYHGEYICRLAGIPFVLIGSQTCYVPQLWDMPAGGCYCHRQRGTVTEDLWDAVALDLKQKELRLYRFGAGEDRKLVYGQEWTR